MSTIQEVEKTVNYMGLGKKTKTCSSPQPVYSHVLVYHEGEEVGQTFAPQQGGVAFLLALKERIR